MGEQRGSETRLLPAICLNHGTRAGRRTLRAIADVTNPDIIRTILHHLRQRAPRQHRSTGATRSYQHRPLFCLLKFQIPRNGLSCVRFGVDRLFDARFISLVNQLLRNQPVMEQPAGNCIRLKTNPRVFQAEAATGQDLSRINPTRALGCRIT